MFAFFILISIVKSKLTIHEFFLKYLNFSKEF